MPRRSDISVYHPPDATPWILQMGADHRKLSFGRYDLRAAETHLGGRRRPDQRSTTTALV